MVTACPAFLCGKDTVTPEPTVANFPNSSFQLTAEERKVAKDFATVDLSPLTFREYVLGHDHGACAPTAARSWAPCSHGPMG